MSGRCPLGYLFVINLSKGTDVDFKDYRNDPKFSDR